MMGIGGAIDRAARMLACAFFLFFAGTGGLRARDMDLLLVLAVDTSGSVNEERFELQKRGYVAAFRDPRLLRAIRGGAHGAIGVTMTQWTGPAMQVWAVPWMQVADAASAAQFADAVAAAPRQLFGGGTSLSGAISHAATLFSLAPFTAPRHVIDVSGDGANNRGAPAALARDAAVAQGITINGLPILGLEPELEIYYRDNVIGGHRAFLIVAQNFESFADAILRKLILEISHRDLDPEIFHRDLDPDQRALVRPVPLRARQGIAPMSQEMFSCPSRTKPCMPVHWTEPGSWSPMAVPRAY